MLGLLALTLYSDARRTARRDADGEFIPLSEQDPQRWDGTLIEEAETLLWRTPRLDAIGRYQLEAALSRGGSAAASIGQRSLGFTMRCAA